MKAETKPARLPGEWTGTWDAHYSRYRLATRRDGVFGYFYGMAAYGVTTEEEDKEKAALIVRAANCHDELVAVLKTLLDECEPENKSREPLCCWNRACAALEKARA